MKSILRSVLAVVAGYAVVVTIVIPLTLVIASASGLGPDDRPTPVYLVANLAMSLAAAVAGGLVAAALAPARRLAHATALGMLFVVLSLVSGGYHPAWYLPVVSAVGLAGTVAGGLLRESTARRRTLGARPRPSDRRA